jgi:D-arabinose 1-dehydrogenase-like Zn-dependent alcohol dehydrogenase
VSGKIDPEGEERMNVNVQAIRRNCTIVGMLNGPRDRFGEMVGFYEEKGVRPVVDRVFRFERAKEALGWLWEGRHFGKVVVRVRG